MKIEHEAVAMTSLDPGVSAPLYQQIKDQIIAKITSGEWRIGARLPNEIELAAQFKVARMTVNRALRELSDAGVLKRTAGVGTFVAERRTHAALVELRDIAAEVMANGARHSSRVLLQKGIEANEFIAGRLGLDYGAAVFHSRVLHFADEAPIQLEERWVNPAVAPQYLEQDFTKATSFRYLSQVAPLSEVEQAVHAVLPRTEEIDLLNITATTPCLLIIRRTWSGDVIASTNRFISPGGRHALASRYSVPPA